MSVNIIYSDTFDEVASAIYAELGRKKSSGHNILIVPDKFSLSAESRLLSKLNLDCSFDIEVMSFNRFAATSMKNKINRCLTPEGSVMLLREAALAVNDRLTVYKNACNDVYFPREIYAVVTSLRNSGVLPESLKGDGLDATERKLADVGLIYEKYLELLEGGLSDGSTRAQAFADYIPEIPNIEKYNIYITDFYEFTATQYDVIERLISFAASVTVGLIAENPSAANRRLTPTRASDRIIATCKRAGIKCDASRYVKDGNLPAYKRQILDNAFAYTDVSSVEIGEEVKLYVAPNVRAETERIARLIRYAVIEKKLRYKDIAVVVSDAGAYADEIKNAFLRYEIPYFLDVKVNFSEQPAAKFILSALKCAEGNFDVDDVNILIKNPFFYGDKNGYREVERFENYCLKYSLSVRPNTPFSDDIAEKVRKKIVDTVSLFSGVNRTTVKEFAQLLERFAAEQRLADKCQAFAESGNGLEERASAQILNKFLAVTDEMKITLPKTETSLTDFINLLDCAFQNVEIALVPMYLDSVYVGEPEESRFDDVKIMFIAGALDKKLPKAAANTAVMGFSEEAELLSRGVDFYPTKTQTVKNNLFYLIQLLTKHKSQLIVSYPESFAGAEGKPSQLIFQLSALFTKEGKQLMPERITDDKFNSPTLTDRERARAYAYKFSTKKNGFYTLLQEVAGESFKPVYASPYDAMTALLDDGDREKLNRFLLPDDYKKPSVTCNLSLARGFFSASQLESYFACPYKHYFGYGIRIKPRQEGKLRTLETGTIAHAVAEAFVKEKAYEGTSTEGVRALVNDAVDRVIEQPDFRCFRGSKHKNTFARLKTECVQILDNLALQISNSDFKPLYSEAEIDFLSADADFKGIKITVDGKDYTLYGKIDRIDECEGYFTVIDYKSYKKALSFTDIYSGEKIQPVLYMTAVTNDKLKYPVGLLYQPVSVGYKKDDTRFKMKGIVIDAPEILTKLDTSLAAECASNFLPVALKKDGTVNGKYARSAVPSEVFSAMSLYVTKLVENALNEMLVSGNVNPSPAKGACDTCDFNAICPYEGVETIIRDKFPQIKSGDFIKLYNGESLSAENCAEDDDG